jgi:hypothetical protein
MEHSRGKAWRTVRAAAMAPPENVTSAFKTNDGVRLVYDTSGGDQSR